MDTRSYDDATLTAAVAQARSWRDVLRRLGLNDASAGSSRSVQAHAHRLGLSHRRFTNQRRWSDSDLATAIAAAVSWADVARLLGLQGGSSAKALKGHALRAGLDTAHLATHALGPAPQIRLSVDRSQLSRAGSMLAAVWFTLSGHDVSWPLEPCAYDVVASTGRGMVRVQVKTTTRRVRGSWLVSLTNSGRAPTTYDPDDIDYFFVVDGDLACYLIPIAAVGGLTSVSLSAYQQYRLPPLALTDASTG